MSFFGFNKRAQHRKFDFIPRYYDADKEELQDRLSKYEGAELDQTELAKRRIQRGLRSKYNVDASYKTAQKSKSRRTLLYTVVILTLLTYLILASDNFIRFIESI